MTPAEDMWLSLIHIFWSPTFTDSAPMLNSSVKQRCEIYRAMLPKPPRPCDVNVSGVHFIRNICGAQRVSGDSVVLSDFRIGYREPEQLCICINCYRPDENARTVDGPCQKNNRLGSGRVISRRSGFPTSLVVRVCGLVLCSYKTHDLLSLTGIEMWWSSLVLFTSRLSNTIHHVIYCISDDQLVPQWVFSEIAFNQLLILLGFFNLITKKFSSLPRFF